MAEPEQDSPRQKGLTELANATGNAVLVLDAGIDGVSFADVVASLNRIGPQDKLSLVLNSPGGSIEAAFGIAKAIRGQCQEFEVIVPDIAKSAATLIALAADRILLGQFGELGPLDPQIPDREGGSGRRSPLEIVKGLEYLRDYYIETFDLMVRFLLEQSGMDVAHTMEHATEALSPIAGALYNSVGYRELGEAVRYLTVSQQYARETMRRWSPLDQASSDAVVETLVWEYPDHGYMIDVDEAHRIGLNNVERLPPGLENRCIAVIDHEGILVKAALPTTDAAVGAGEDDSPMAAGDENETEHGAYCQ